MSRLETIIGWAFGLIILFLLLSRAAEANAIINTLGGFVSTETRNLQGYGPGGQIVSSQATNLLRYGAGSNAYSWSY